MLINGLFRNRIVGDSFALRKCSKEVRMVSKELPVFLYRSVSNPNQKCNVFPKKGDFFLVRMADMTMTRVTQQRSVESRIRIPTSNMVKLQRIIPATENTSMFIEVEKANFQGEWVREVHRIRLAVPEYPAAYIPRDTAHRRKTARIPSVDFVYQQQVCADTPQRGANRRAHFRLRS